MRENQVKVVPSTKKISVVSIVRSRTGVVGGRDRREGGEKRDEVVLINWY